MRRRTAVFATSLVLIVSFAWTILPGFIKNSFRDGYSSQTVLVPAIAAYFAWSARKKIFAIVEWSLKSGLLVVSVGVAGFLMTSKVSALGSGAGWVATELIFVLVMLVGAFIASYGTRAFRATAFCFLLLLFMLPFPTGMIDRIVLFLQAGSTELVYLTFSVLGIPVLREGFILHLPSVSIEVARECSGINSSVALLITMILIAVKKLRTTSRRLVLIATVIPLSLVKNSIRIVTLTLLAIYVDPSFLTGRLHHQGGVVFYLIAFVPMYVMLKALQKSEQAKETGACNLRCRAAETLPQPKTIE